MLDLQTNEPTKLLTDNGVIEDPTKISEHFNNYFSEMGANIAKNASVNINNDTTFKKYLKSSIINTIILDSPQTTKVYIINSLNPHKAQRHDISSHFLRLGSEVLAPILAQLFFHVFELGYFPQIFKTAKVIPVFKSGNKELVNNYRPIPPSLFIQSSRKTQKRDFQSSSTSKKFCVVTNAALERIIL